jgi:hypothetical protein
MSVDLTLLPFDGDSGESLSFSHTVLNVEGSYDLWDEIEKLPALQVPDGFNTHMAFGEDGEHCYGKTTETPYGKPLLYTTVNQLLKLRDQAYSVGGTKNRAIWAYLSELPSKTKVALYWH